MNLNDPHLLEKLAAQEHDRWAGWMEYLFSKCQFKPNPASPGVGSFEAIIPAASVDHWQRQIDTKYADLSEREKESDRVEARKTLALLVEEKNKFPLGCLLPDGHDGPCVEAKWEPLGDWLMARPTPEWYMNVATFCATGFFKGHYWSVGGEAGRSVNDDLITGYAPTVEAAKAKAEAVLRALLSVPGGL